MLSIEDIQKLSIENTEELKHLTGLLKDTEDNAEIKEVLNTLISLTEKFNVILSDEITSHGSKKGVE